MSLLYSPLSWSLLALIMWAFALARGYRLLALMALLAGVPALGLMTPFGANLLVLAIEQRVKPAPNHPACDNIQAMVLLSGGLQRPAQSADDFDALSPESMSRILAYIRSDPPGHLLLIIAGGDHFQPPDAQIIRTLMVQLDSLPNEVHLETTALSTSDSARAVASLLPAGVERIGLASSALHLPRSIRAFRQTGLEVCPWPLNSHYIRARGWRSMLPQSSSLRKSETALHELIGQVYYRLGRPGAEDFGSRESGVGGQKSEARVGARQCDPTYGPIWWRELI